MKVEYVTSTLEMGTELHISVAEYMHTNSENGWSNYSGHHMEVPLHLGQRRWPKE